MNTSETASLRSTVNDLRSLIPSVSTKFMRSPACSPMSQLNVTEIELQTIQAELERIAIRITDIAVVEESVDNA